MTNTKDELIKLIAGVPKERLRFLLSPRQEQVVALRLEGFTLEAIGERLGICKETVRQRQNQAIRKLRRNVT